MDPVAMLPLAVEELTTLDEIETLLVVLDELTQGLVGNVLL